MKTLYEKMRDNRVKAFGVKTARWIEQKEAKVQADRERYEKQFEYYKREYGLQREAIRSHGLRGSLFG